MFILLMRKQRHREAEEFNMSPEDELQGLICSLVHSLFSDI